MLFVHFAVSYVSSTAAAAAAAESEDTRERTTPHLLETAVLSRKYTSTEKTHVSGRARERVNEGERDEGTQGENREDAVCYSIITSSRYLSLCVRKEKKVRLG